MVFVIERLKRSTALAAAVLLLLASSAPLLAGQTASAYTLLGDREIKMSTSEGGATGVTHRADFDISTTGDVGGFVITFCENSPIIGDTSCVEPAGISLSATFANADAGTHDLSGWTASVGSHSDAGTANNTFFLTNATAVAMTGGDNIVFEMTSADNPTAVGTFYARIMTYETDTNANGYTLADPEAGGPIVDAGGIALSTAELITIEAKVQERITFCVFATDGALSYDGTDCNAVTDPVQLGDTNGVLDSSNPSITKDAKFNITTNASTGATIRMKGNTLETGSFSIDPAGDVTAGDGVAVASDPGSEQFGLCVYRDTGGGATGLTPTAPYDDVNCSGTTDGQGAGNDNSALFAFDETELSTSLYGDSVATKTAGDWSTGVAVFLGNVSNTTEPGIYTTTLDFIATGRY